MVGADSLPGDAVGTDSERENALDVLALRDQWRRGAHFKSETDLAVQPEGQAPWSVTHSKQSADGLRDHFMGRGDGPCSPNQLNSPIELCLPSG